MKSLAPHFERKLFAAGYDLVAGADEVGRGALAGPLVAAIVVFDKPAILRFARIAELPIRDSKTLSRTQRERLSPLIKRHALAVAVGQVSHREIDARGMGWASREVFYRLLAKCKIKNAKCKILIDAVRLPQLTVPHESIIHGDSKIFSIAASSIVAKVHRDKLMRRYAEHYPAYGFDRHVGYGTEAHRDAIDKHGPCPLHRKSFVLSSPRTL